MNMLDFIKKIANSINTPAATSDAGIVNKTDIKSILIKAGISGVAAVAAVLANNLAGLDLGQYTALVVPVIYSALTALQKWAADNSK
jgi:hypothetical protein